MVMVIGSGKIEGSHAGPRAGLQEASCHSSLETKAGAVANTFHPLCCCQADKSGVVSIWEMRPAQLRSFLGFSKTPKCWHGAWLRECRCRASCNRSRMCYCGDPCFTAVHILAPKTKAWGFPGGLSV